MLRICPPIAVILTLLNPVARAGSIEVIAHRGVHQPLSQQVSIAPWACTAQLVEPLEHAFVENSLASIRAAYAAGATTVEIDVHATVDGEAVVFHDWTLGCRTDGHGVTEQQALASLLELDIGHGYSPDHGRSFPLRGRGLRMPTLRQVLETFPQGRLLLNMKSGNPQALETILAALADYPDRDLTFYCSKPAINQAVRERLAWIRVPKLDRSGIRTCLRALALPFGEIPGSCRGAELMLPWESFRELGPLAAALLARIHAAGSKLYLWGVDDAQAARCAARFAIDGLVTNRVERVGPALRAATNRPTQGQ